jgi:hypothetical protein
MLFVHNSSHGYSHKLPLAGDNAPEIGFGAFAIGMGPIYPAEREVFTHGRYGGVQRLRDFHGCKFEMRKDYEWLVLH